MRPGGMTIVKQQDMEVLGVDLVTPQVFGFLNCIAFHELEHHSFMHELIICETLQHVFIFHVCYEASSVQHTSTICATSF
jgi:hypothetical protein